MLQLSYPGVYVQELPSGNRPIGNAATSKAILVGQAEMGPSEPQHISSWEEYQRVFGGFTVGADRSAYLPHSVFQFFNNGGRQCYVLRQVGSSDARARTVLLSAAEPDGTDAVAVQLSAKSTGAWGNSLLVSVSPGSLDAQNEVRLELRRSPSETLGADEIARLPILETHDNLSLNPSAANSIVGVLKQDSQLLDAAFPASAAEAGPAIHRGAVLTARISRWAAEWPPSGKLLVSSNGSPFRLVSLELAADEIPANLAGAVAALTELIEATPELSELQVRATADNRIEFVSTHNPDTERSVSVRAVPSEPRLANVLGFGSDAEQPSAAADRSVLLLPFRTRRPAFTLTRSGTSTTDRPYRLGRADERVSATTAGTDGPWPSSIATLLTKLNTTNDASVLVVPGRSEHYDECVTYCENRPLHDIFFIGDCANTDDSESKALSLRGRLTKPNGLGALYFPWLKARDPSGVSQDPIELPPSGFVAGVYARIDAARGVWKAPAGLEASVSGVVGLKAELSDAQHGLLNLAGVNVIRRFATGGLVVWGARTVSSDARQVYVAIRRTQSMIQRSVYEGLQSAVFEPNDHRLWSSLRADVGAFLNSLFRAGAFQGNTAREAYVVRCGLTETMTQADVDRGIVIIDVGFAPLKPAEFIVVRIQQQVAQS